MQIYFGSQTGTAESFAYELCDESISKGVAAQVVDLEGFVAPASASGEVHVFIVATTGEGEPTDNAAKFHAWASDPKSGNCALEGMQFAVFGLGDRNYANFNHIGELTDANIERLGGCRVCARGIGDDAGDIVEDFRTWRRDVLWPACQALSAKAVLDAKGVSVGAGATAAAGAVFGTLHMATSVSELPAEVPGRPADVLVRFYFEAERARVKVVRELRQVRDLDEGESTVHVELDVSGCAGFAACTAGGNIEVLPENDPADVAAILPLLGISEAAKPGDVGDLDCCITFAMPSEAGVELSKPFPTPCSLREALTRYCDLQRAPTRRMLKALRPGLEPVVQERVDRLLGDEVAMKLVDDAALSWTQVEFWSCVGAQRLDLSSFLQHCPRQRARPYTVASSPVTHPGEIHLCVSMNSRPAEPLGAAVAALCARGVFPAGCTAPSRPSRWYGVCSNWMCTRLANNSMVLVRSRPSALRLVDADVPIVMISAGAGVAPFRGFWQELGERFQRRSPAALFFGCRHPERDWIYRADMSSCAAVVASAHAGGYGPHSATTNGSGQLVAKRPALPGGLFVAFSRKGEEGVYDPSGCCGEYVQDQLRANAAQLQEWVHAGGVIYICGSNAVGHSVSTTLGEIIAGGNEEVQRLRASGRIVQELWGEPPRPPGSFDAELSPSVDANFAGAGAGKRAEVEDLALKLSEAVKNGDHCQVEKLIEMGADVNLQAHGRKYTRIGLRQEVGETPLHWAALRGDETVAAWLLAAHADPNLRDQDGKAPLHIAAFNGVTKVTEQLLKAHADPDALDVRGNTPMQWVVLAGGSMRMLRMLLKYGARGDIANEDGDLAADVAEERGSNVAAELIRSAIEAREQ